MSSPADLARELRHVARQLSRSPGFTAVAIFTLALGIGANTAIFSLVDAVLLRPLPFPESERLVSVWHTAPGMGADRFELSEATYLMFEEATPRIESMAAYDSHEMNLLTGGDQPERLAVSRVTTSLFSTLGVRPLLGRELDDRDSHPGAPLVALISEGFWRARFAASAQVLGQTLQIDGRAHDIVGVLPDAMRFPSAEVQIWIPYPLDASQPMVTAFRLGSVARLAPGADAEAAAAELTARFYDLPELYPGEIPLEAMQDADMGVLVIPLAEDMVGDAARVLWVLLGTVGLVLLIACANVANLFLVRAEGRQREIALRRALGAGGSGIVRLYLLESVLLALLGGLAGLAFAALGLKLLVATGPEQIPRLWEVGINARAGAAAAALSILTGLTCGALPALRHRSGPLASSLKEGGRAGDGGPQRHRTRYILVAAQVALALVLLVGSGLLVRTFWSLRAVDPGFSATQALTLRLSLSEAAYPTQEDVVRFVAQLHEALEALPAVTASGSTDLLPLVSRGGQFGVWVEDHPPEPGSLPASHPVRLASPNYFAAAGIPLLEGRGFDARGERDRDTVLVSEAFASHYWSDPETAGSPLGRRVRLGGTPHRWHTVVGVVGSVLEGSLQAAPAETVYFPTTQANPMLVDKARSMSLVLRSPLAVTSLLPQVRERIHELDRTLPIAQVRTMDQLASESMARNTFSASVLGLAAVVALVLGSVGVYGVLAYIVGQRQREFGIRIALGAQTRDVGSLVIRQGLSVVAAGVGIGLVGSVALTRLLEALLFGVDPRDPWTFLAGTVLLLGAATLASYAPARRASQVDPSVALRSE